MNFLIDGYNLLHAIGWAPLVKSSGKLEPARQKLLEWLADATPMREGLVQFRVVFDAQNGRAPSGGKSHRGVVIHFAYKKTADDLIEEMLDAAKVPKSITVVSNDARLSEAARRAGATGWGSKEFLDWLGDWDRAMPGEEDYEPPEKPVGTIPAKEKSELLAAFSKPKPR